MISGVSSFFVNTIQSASAYTRAWRSEASGGSMERDAGTAKERPADARPGSTRTNEPSAADLRRIEEMKATDRAVRAHEAAHMAAGGNLVTSGASYSYETGPDGQRYVVAGEVGIDTSKGRTPEETLARADQIRAAALAPADPSAQDRAVAAAATQIAAEARAEIALANMEKGKAGAPEENGQDGGMRFPPAARGGESGNDGRGISFGDAIARSLIPTAGQALDIRA
ncbi:MAG: hypothetical protein LBT71_06405 [Azoarcus sp.]|jgi:hypothetical protein|nr:hypothetical protein [Azoarcus sp.]